MDNNGNTQLHNIISNSDGTLEVVQNLIEENADINATSLSQNTPLFYAVYYNKYDIFNYLIENGADVNKSTYSALGWAVEIFVLAEYMIHKYGKTDEYIQQKEYELKSRENKKIIELLLKKGADVNMPHPDLKITPFDDLLRHLPDKLDDKLDDKPSDDYISMIKLFIKKGTIISDAQLEIMKIRLPSLINCAKKYKYIKSIN